MKSRRETRRRSTTVKWEHVGFVESWTERGLEYEIKRRLADGHLGCGCGAYRFARGIKTCKHLGAYGVASNPIGERAVGRVLTSGVIEQTVTVAAETFSVRRRAISFEPLTAESVR